MAKKKKPTETKIKKEEPDMPRISQMFKAFTLMPKQEQIALIAMMEMMEALPKKQQKAFYLNLLEEIDKAMEEDGADVLDDEDEDFYDEDEDEVDFEDFDEDDDDDDFDDEDDDDDDEYSNFDPFLKRKNVKKYTLRVTLKDIKPSIYRKFVVPSNISLRGLSELIADLMGWTHSHLDQFRVGRTYYMPSYQMEHDPFSCGEAQEDYALSDVLSEKGKSIEWEYDFGDSWRHEVKLSSIGEYEKGEPKVSFVKGERACPPEDCGGVWGYAEILALYERHKAGKPLTDEETEQYEWCGEDEFDPEAFDIDLAKGLCETFSDD